MQAHPPLLSVACCLGIPMYSRARSHALHCTPLLLWRWLELVGVGWLEEVHMDYYPPQDLHITLVTVAVPLAIVSTLLALAFLWQAWTQYRLRRAGKLGDASW